LERHYTEQEVTEAIRRAAELQERLAEGVSESRKVSQQGGE
jgi:hypothetical protein